jgi:hypothetical protein
VAGILAETVNANISSAASAASAAATAAGNAQTAANSALSTRLSKTGADTIVGPISLQAADSILVGSTTTGLYLGSTGIVGRKAGATTFAVDQAGNAFFGGTLGARTVTATTLAASVALVDQVISSSNYSAGAAGWAIKYDGSAEFGVLSIRGDVVTASGSPSTASASFVDGIVLTSPSGTPPTVPYRLELTVAGGMIGAYTLGQGEVQLYDATGGVELALWSNANSGSYNMPISGVYSVDVPANATRTIKLRLRRVTGSPPFTMMQSSLKASVRSLNF